MSSSIAVNKTAHPFNKQQLESVLTQRFFYAPAFEIYGGVAGLYDYGPPGSALQANIIAEWRKHFIIEDSMLELDTTVMTPAPVFEASGHVARFADWMVKDAKTGEVLRADHLVKGVLEARLVGDREARGEKSVADTSVDDGEKKKKKKVKAIATRLPDETVHLYESILAQLDNYSGPELGLLCKEHKITNPDTGNEVSEPQAFNLMFGSSIGPTGQHPGYLRPETAQGHFLNFSRLLDFNYNRIPFASAQIGRSFRNEISPRAGLLRVREFTMAEIEHFVDPLDKSHEKFHLIKDVTICVLPRETQAEGKTDLTSIKVGEAVSTGIIANETLGYFVARIHQFLLKIGIDENRLRFRQHMSNEMAHYATDCWDAEIYSSVGWIECIGCADRAAYDLTVHMQKTGKPLVVRQSLKDPIISEKDVVEFNNKIMGKTFGKDLKFVTEAVKDIEADEPRLARFKNELAQGSTTLKVNGQEFKLTTDMVSVKHTVIKQTTREFTPNVIEPSFGLGRILYMLLEHSWWTREDDQQRGVLSLPMAVAPIKVLIVPLSAKEEFQPLVQELRAEGVLCRVDDSTASIGKRYARNDELGTPFGITVDFASIKNRTLTLRERDTTRQLIGTVEDVTSIVCALIKGDMTWSQAEGRLDVYDGVQAVE
ncbi:hypothetical protein Clacol_007374 [Clathrus columnatus]|uniref:glycine--tRNA ligase n=1 Tax=Clathrus columnatus TaxID=1419009 RepID=A0AAV5AER1_9AGAM|nr:hypothetical protein Clacol_007374 [Clathrus columnatus]